MTGAAVTGTAATTASSCQVAGTVSRQTLLLTTSACSPASVSVGIISGCGDQAWSRDDTGGTFSGRVSESTLTGEGTDTAFASTAGQRHSMSVPYRATFTR